METFEYAFDYDGEINKVRVPALEGRELIGSPHSFYCDYQHLNPDEYSYNVWFNPYNTNTFAEIYMQKEGGDSESARASSYYCELSADEVEYLLADVIEATLGLGEFKLKRKRKKRV